MLPGMGPVRLRKLLAIYHSPERVLLAAREDLRRIEGIGPEVAENIINWDSLVDLPSELKRIEEFGVKVLTQNCPGYPPELREIHAPPIVLYMWGTLSEADRSGIGVVGSRNASVYGLESAKKLSYQIAYAGLTVFSGLARGVDTAAHQGALAANGRTVAVLGAGLNRLYPPENRALAEKIADSGAVITEFSMEVEADRQTFPMRNRIISGCCSGLLVVEAGVRSGALISARQALDEGRSVYAIPGRIDHPGAIGSNRLIQGGAKLVMSASDILEDMEMLLPRLPKHKPPPSRAGTLLGEEKLVYEAVPDTEGTIDEIVANCRLPTQKVSTTLLTLEMRRFVKQLPGQRFVKLS
jgi:DNA processing protein